METVLFSEETPTLRLGPGPSLPESEVIRFVNGYAEIAADDPNYDEKMRWVAVTPGVEVLSEADRGRIVPRDGDTRSFVCNDPSHEDPKSFETQKALNMHRLGAHRVRVAVPA